MKSARERLALLGVKVPEILLPAEDADFSKWSVIACDQFTSEKDYWERCRKEVGQAPSTLNLILPECYLSSCNPEEETLKINETMKSYRKEVLSSRGEGMIFVERSTPWVKKRKGLMLALDLDAYEFHQGTESLIRPTEATVVDRLPARIAVRRKAELDLPHILVIMDDPEDLVMKAAEKAAGDKVYDFELMEKGGHISGSWIQEETGLSALADAFEELNRKNPFLFAIGDGNHSLASAKEIWRDMKASGIKDHPARYALVELENIHDPGLVFEPIHRILFGIDQDKLQKDMQGSLNPRTETLSSLDEMKKAVESEPNVLGSYDGKEFTLYRLDLPESKLPAESFHEFLDPWTESNPCKEVDYIHGDEAFRELSSAQGNIGFYLPAIDKNRFFDLVDKKGSLPRKTFSIGEAQEKRYYLESRSLVLD